MTDTSQKDRIQPFQTESTGLRGRLVRLGPLLDRVLGRYEYPEPVARLLGDAVLLAAALASNLKYQGVFTLQIKGDGPVNLIVVDVLGSLVEAPRAIRGTSRFDRDAVAKMSTDRYMLQMSLLGRGWLAFTVDQGADTERYQGIVELRGRTLAECVQHYFLQSEQIASAVTVALDRKNGLWNGTALLMQRLPTSPADVAASDAEDDWQRIMVLMSTLGNSELLDQTLPDQYLLWRVFHQDGLLLYRPERLIAGCRCSRDKVVSTLRALGPQQMSGLVEEGVARVTCEFCNTEYRFDDQELAALHRAP